MNVDEAMAIAVKKFGWPFKYEHHSNPSIISHAVLAEEVNRLQGESYFKAEANKRLAEEVERLRAELAQLRKDWCDDDEAIKQQSLRVLDAAKVEGDSWSVPRGSALAEMMADENERLRTELELSKANAETLKKALLEVQDAAIRLGDKLDEAQAELAAAKAELEKLVSDTIKRNGWGAE